MPETPYETITVDGLDVEVPSLWTYGDTVDKVSALRAQFHEDRAQFGEAEAIARHERRMA